MRASSRGRLIHPILAPRSPELTGGDFVFLSPGLRLALHEPWAAYAFVQQPLYQDVNGLQLVAERNWLFGVQGRW